MFFTGSRARGSRIREEGSLLPLRPELNFIGTGITAADNAAAGRTDVTVVSSGLPVYNVMSSPYSAVGNGTTNDRAAIQAAIDAAYAAGGGIVLLPIGFTFRITSALNLWPGVHLVGNPVALPLRATYNSTGRGGPILLVDFASGAVLNCGGYEWSVTGIYFKSDTARTSGATIATIDGTVFNTQTGGGFDSSWARAHISRCFFYNQYDGISGGGNGVWISDCDFNTQVHDGIIISGIENHVSGIYFENTNTLATGAGLRISGDGSWFTDCDIIGATIGVAVAGTNVHLSNVFADCCPVAFKVSNDEVTMVGCYAAACDLAFNHTSSMYGVQVQNGSDRVIIDGLYVRRGGAAILLEGGCGTVSITGGMARAQNGGGTSGLDDGIKFTGITDNVSIVNFNARKIAGTALVTGGYAHTNLYVRSPGMTDTGT